MFTGPIGPVEVFFYWPEAVLGNFYWPGAIGSPLASSPGVLHRESTRDGSCSCSDPERGTLRFLPSLAMM